MPEQSTAASERQKNSRAIFVERFRSMPPNLRARLIEGVPAVLSMTAEAIEIGLNQISEAGRSEVLDIKTFSERVGVASELATPITAVLSVVGLAGPGALDDLSAALVEVGICDAAQAAALIEKLRPSTQASAARFSRQIEERRAAALALPNLAETHWAVDLRPVFVAGKVERLIPIGLVTFLTDVDDIKLHCQVSESELGQLLHTLERVKERMQALVKQFGGPEN